CQGQQAACGYWGDAGDCGVHTGGGVGADLISAEGAGGACEAALDASRFLWFILLMFCSFHCTAERAGAWGVPVSVQSGSGGGTEKQPVKPVKAYEIAYPVLIRFLHA